MKWHKGPPGGMGAIGALLREKATQPELLRSRQNEKHTCTHMR